MVIHNVGYILVGWGWTVLFLVPAIFYNAKNQWRSPLYCLALVYRIIWGLCLWRFWPMFLLLGGCWYKRQVRLQIRGGGYWTILAYHHEGHYWDYYTTVLSLIDCGLVTPYGSIDLGQNWLSYWLVTSKSLPEPVLTSYKWGPETLTRD